MAPRLLTLANAVAGVKNPRVLYLFNLPTVCWRMGTRGSVCLRALRCAKAPTWNAPRLLGRISDVALLGGAGMPLGVREMRAAEPLPAAVAILLSAFAAGLVHARN